MALATNALTSYSAVGNREDLQDTICSISPTDTPIMSSIGQTQQQQLRTNGKQMP